MAIVKNSQIDLYADSGVKNAIRFKVNRQDIIDWEITSIRGAHTANELDKILVLSRFHYIIELR